MPMYMYWVLYVCTTGYMYSYIYFLMRCEVRTFLRDVSYCYSYYCYMLLNEDVPVDILVYNMWYPCTHMYVVHVTVHVLYVVYVFLLGSLLF